MSYMRVMLNKWKGSATGRNANAYSDLSTRQMTEVASNDNEAAGKEASELSGEPYLMGKAMAWRDIITIVIGT